MNVQPRLALPFLVASLLSFGPARAQSIVAERANEPARRIVRIDGREVRTSIQPVADFPSSGGERGDGPLGILSAPSPAVVIDAWSHKTATSGFSEDYDFSATDDVQFTLFAKIPQAGVGGSGGESFDMFLLPCGTSALPPLVRPIIFVDDVQFAPIPPALGDHSFFFTITLTAAQVGQAFPVGTCVDWFVAVDFDATDNPDVDGNGRPDCCVELRPVRFIDLGSPNADVIGAGLLHFFGPGARPLDIFEPHPPSPAAKAAGAKPGEDGTTRPWCFQIR